MTQLDRLRTAIALGKPDRTPVCPTMSTFAARYAGITIAEFLDSADRSWEALDKTYEGMGGWDGMYWPRMPNALALALAQPMRVLLPGKELPPDALWQFDERPVMTVEDYDTVIAHGWNATWEQLAPRFMDIELDQIPILAEEWITSVAQGVDRYAQRGIPVLVGVSVSTPFDLFSAARSMDQFALDLYRRPEKVIAAMDAAIDDEIARGLKAMERGKGLWLSLGACRASGSFISPKQFERFYLPWLKKMVGAFAAAGHITLLHFDTDWTVQLPFLKELPRGMCILDLDGFTDIFKAKEILRDHMCIMGDVHPTLLTLATPDEVERRCRELIDVVGDGGGFILGSGCHVPIDAKPENVRAMIDAAKG